MTAQEIMESIHNLPVKERLKVYEEMLRYFNKDGLKDLTDKEILEYFKEKSDD